MDWKGTFFFGEEKEKGVAEKVSNGMMMAKKKVFSGITVVAMRIRKLKNLLQYLRPKFGAVVLVIGTKKMICWKR